MRSNPAEIQRSPSWHRGHKNIQIFEKQNRENPENWETNLGKNLDTQETKLRKFVIFSQKSWKGIQLIFFLFLTNLLFNKEKIKGLICWIRLRNLCRFFYWTVHTDNIYAAIWTIQSRNIKTYIFTTQRQYSCLDYMEFFSSLTKKILETIFFTKNAITGLLSSQL